MKLHCDCAVAAAPTPAPTPAPTAPTAPAAYADNPVAPTDCSLVVYRRYTLCDNHGMNNSDLRGECRTSRSEEHTSELQSLMRISYAVFCLKKKKKQTKP